MYLKEIQTYGFKSFADKINFEFTKNLNGIVGPNGSGKSNVVDAVRWVMGEGSSKQLRLSDTTSVIFSGSKSRKALNSAMVNIIFDNSDRSLPIDFNEVSIKRILYRSGDNEYCLNGEKCRLKDITELLTDSGAAKESFNIIGQGKIDEILSTKPYDRRVTFEEAAGVLKYKKRKEEAIRKLDRTNSNINRVNDIIKELEGNLEPLREQSEIAKKYTLYKDKLTSYDISLMIYDVDNYSHEFESNKDKIISLNDKITELSTNNSNYDIDILGLKDKFNKLNMELSNINSNILNSTKELEQTDADIRILRERKKYVTTDSNITKINNIKESILNKTNELNSINNDIELLNKKIKIREEDIVNNTSKYNELNSNISKYNDKINNNNRYITDINYKINYLEDSINNNNDIPSNIKNLLHNPLFSGVHNVIGKLITVDNEYALAVSTALGGASNYLVVDDNKLASRMVEYLKTNKLGRATFFPLNVIKPRYIDSEIIDKIKLMEGYLGVLDSFVKYDNKYENIIKNQLGNVILADNTDNANKISSIINNKYKIVTLDGQVVNIGGSITGGEKIKTNNTISQKYELSEYKTKLSLLLNTNQDYLSELTILQNKLNEYNSKIYNARIDKDTLLEQAKNKENVQAKLKLEIDSLVKELKDIETISNNNSDNEENNLLEKYYKIKENIDKLNKDSNIIKLDRDKIEKDINELEEISKNSIVNINKLERELKDIEVKNSKLEVKIDTILNSLNEDYSITYSDAKEKYILEEDVNSVRNEVVKLKNIIRDFGIVNIGAIEEYERVNKRYEFLTKQREDLNKAENTLLDIINDMDNIMKDKFVNTFNEIRQEFKKVFKELFRGGDADIYMTDPDNILETGIELEATPPGKNLRNIQALSGGERTFTAISLLFAILNVRPVPFCIFDEVEAALDDANVDAFGEYLNKYRDKTQFIIITHKKKTMEFIDTLYGITMQESGVSKRVSVKLNDVKGDK